MVICDRSATCGRRHECGGAMIHDRCSECGRCPVIPAQRCGDVREGETAEGAAGRLRRELWERETAPVDPGLMFPTFKEGGR